MEYDCSQPLFSRISIRSLNTRRQSQENWTPAQNGRLDWVGVETQGGGHPVPFLTRAAAYRS